MLDWFRRWMAPEKNVPRRLDAAAARAIAEAAFAQSPLYGTRGSDTFNYLSDLGVQVRDGRVEWTFITPTKGSGVAVTVDDATGAAEVRRWGVR